MDHCRNGLTILNFGELASPPYPSGGGSGGGGSGSAGSGTTGSAGGGSDTESDQESVGSRSSVNFIPSFYNDHDYNLPQEKLSCTLILIYSCPLVASDYVNI